MSNNNSSTNIRNYGATSSSSNLPEVNFSGFSPTEFMSLSEDIGYNINAVAYSWKQLEKIYKVIGTPRDLPSTREKVHNIHTKINALVETTSKDLQRLTSVVQRGDKQQKLQLERLTTDFRNVVENYSSVQQKISAAMKLTYSQSENCRRQDEETMAAADFEKAELIQRQKETQASLQFEQDILVERDRQIKQIEANILDVNSIMRTISNILQAQTENVDRIETSINTTAAEVELGRDELAKTAQHRQSYRRKMLILLAIAVIIGLIVTGIIVGKLYN